MLAGASAHVFDSIDVSSKARGMGGAWSATGDDATAVAYNPALLMDVERMSVAVTYLKPNQQSSNNQASRPSGRWSAERKSRGSAPTVSVSIPSSDASRS